MLIVCYDTGKRNITLINQVFREVHSLNNSVMCLATMAIIIIVEGGDQIVALDDR